MKNNKNFDPLAWAGATVSPQPTANENCIGQPLTTGQVENPVDQPLTGGHVVNLASQARPSLNGAPGEAELQKAEAVAQQLLERGCNIAESYDDYLHLGFALADGLGAQGRDIYHRLCAMSTKYNERECERKWQECLRKHDGRTTIASFYKMAQTAGVDLKTVSRQYPSFPPFPPLRHGSAESTLGVSTEGVNSTLNTNNKGVTHKIPLPPPPCNNSSQTLGGVAEMAENGATNATKAIDASQLPSPTFSDKINPEDLPSLLRDAAQTQQTTEGRDKTILATLNLTSAFMPNVCGVYDKRLVYAPFYTFFVAPSGALKGEVTACRALVDPIVWEIRSQYEAAHKSYLQQKAAYDAMNRSQRATATEPEEPPYRSPMISVNASATAFYQDLAANEGWGAIFETEGDALTQAIKQDYGDYSSGLRKAFHHETIDYSRRRDNEHVYIREPRLSALITCTPGQIPLLLSPQNTENGLANRFVFYLLRKGSGWRNVFEGSETTLYDELKPLGERFRQLYHALLPFAAQPLRFTLTEEQKLRFNDFFSPLYDEQIGLYGDELEAFVFRLGLTTYRIAMVLTVLRHEEFQPCFNPQNEPLVCSEGDFLTAITIASCLINHTVFVYKRLLPHAEAPLSTSGKPMSAPELQFLRALPQTFTRADFLQVAQQLGIAQRTAERYVGAFIADYAVVVRITTGHYRKV